jgi:putative phosphoesterase
MKRIGVVSDTHIPKAASDLPEAVYKAFEKVDLILHAGDLVEIGVLKKLEKIAPVRAVCGNMDMPEVRATLPQKDIISVGGLKIGLIHGYGPPSRLMESISGEFKRVDAVVFGHSHIPLCEKKGKVLYFNPGSPTDRIFAAYNSYGILEAGKDIRGSIIRI